MKNKRKTHLKYEKILKMKKIKITMKNQNYNYYMCIYYIIEKINFDNYWY